MSGNCSQSVLPLASGSALPLFFFYNLSQSGYLNNTFAVIVFLLVCSLVYFYSYKFFFKRRLQKVVYFISLAIALWAIDVVLESGFVREHIAMLIAFIGFIKCGFDIVFLTVVTHYQNDR